MMSELKYLYYKQIMKKQITMNDIPDFMESSVLELLLQKELMHAGLFLSESYTVQLKQTSAYTDIQPGQIFTAEHPDFIVLSKIGMIRYVKTTTHLDAMINFFETYLPGCTIPSVFRFESMIESAILEEYQHGTITEADAISRLHRLNIVEYDDLASYELVEFK